MRFNTKAILAVAVALTMLAPVATQAAQLTADQINSVLGLLQSFNVDTKTVDTVRAVLNNQPAPHREDGDDRNATSTERGGERQKPPMPPGQMVKCVALMRNIGPGTRGDDVREIQEMLKGAPEAGFTGSSTGYYGPMTAEAMKRFQTANGIASTTTGTVGPRTREFFEMRCRKEKGVQQVPPPTPAMTPNTVQ